VAGNEILQALAMEWKRYLGLLCSLCRLFFQGSNTGEPIAQRLDIAQSDHLFGKPSTCDYDPGLFHRR
jgi:hypothetical protein